jgi:hypothetical protein
MREIKKGVPGSMKTSFISFVRVSARLKSRTLIYAMTERDRRAIPASRAAPGSSIVSGAESL